jgi:hypothetical protein
MPLNAASWECMNSAAAVLSDPPASLARPMPQYRESRTAVKASLSARSAVIKTQELQFGQTRYWGGQGGC